MARRGGYSYTLTNLIRAQEQNRRSKQAAVRDSQRKQLARRRDAERAAQASLRASAAGERERLALYQHQRQQEAEQRSAEIAGLVDALGRILASAEDRDLRLDFESMKSAPDIPSFDAAGLEDVEPEPVLERFLPRSTPLHRLSKRLRVAHARGTEVARRRFDWASYERALREAARVEALAGAHAAHAEHVSVLEQQAEAANAEVDDFRDSVTRGEPEAVEEYFLLALDASRYDVGPDMDLGLNFEFGYEPKARKLVIEADLPGFRVVELAKAFRYVKAHDEIRQSDRTPAQRKTLYLSVISQVALRALHEAFSADPCGLLDEAAFSGFVEARDPATGRDRYFCLVTVQASRNRFDELDLVELEPVACLRQFGGKLSKSPFDLAEVKPVASIDHDRLDDAVDETIGFDDA